MGKLVLKKEILDKVKKDPVLYGRVAESVGVSAFSLPGLIYNNSQKLTQAYVLNTIREHLNLPQDTELLEEMQEPAKEKVA